MELSKAFPKALDNAHTRVARIRAVRDIGAAAIQQLKNGDLNAFITSRCTSKSDLDALSARPLSRLVKRPSSKKNPYHGKLFALKDNIATSNSSKLPTTCASGILQQYQSPFDASVVAKLNDNDHLVIGKTNLDEFGMGSHSTNSFHGSVHNYVSKQISAGGSSGGSAVAVATGQCLESLGTDTGGSIRLPAAYNGVVGYKPSYGFVSRWGIIPYANSLDTVGILSQSVLGSKDFLQMARDNDHKDPTHVPDKVQKRISSLRRSAGRPTAQTLLHNFKMWRTVRVKHPGNTERQPFLADLKIGIPIEYNIMELEPCIRQAWEDSLIEFQSLGCTLVPVSLPTTKHALSSYYVIAASEAASNLSKYDGIRYGTRSTSADGSGDVLFSSTRGEGFGDEVKRRILLGSYTLSSAAIDNYFIQAQKVRRLVQRDFDRIFALPNPLQPPQQFDLSDMDPSIELENKLGPSQVDFIVCPTAPTLPPTLKSISEQTPVDSYMNDVFTVPSSLAGLPAISIPFPIQETLRQPDKPAFAGIQIIGQYGDDLRLISVAEIFDELNRNIEHTLTDSTLASARRIAVLSEGRRKQTQTSLKTDAYATPDVRWRPYRIRRLDRRPKVRFIRLDKRSDLKARFMIRHTTAGSKSDIFTKNKIRRRRRIIRQLYDVRPKARFTPSQARRRVRKIGSKTPVALRKPISEKAIDDWMTTMLQTGEENDNQDSGS